MIYNEPPFELGETLSGTNPNNSAVLINYDWLGQVFMFPTQNLAGSSIRASKSRLTGKVIRAVALRNTAAIALSATRIGILTYGTAGDAGIETVSGYAKLTAEQRIVIVDPFLSSATTVAVNDIFWGVISGRVLVTTGLTAATATGEIAVGDPLIAQTAVTSGSTTAGRAQKIAFTNATAGETGATYDAFRFSKNMLGWALSARTSGETGALLLIDACINY